jgi:hypothetical protein
MSRLVDATQRLRASGANAIVTPIFSPRGILARGPTGRPVSVRKHWTSSDPTAMAIISPSRE